MRRRYDQNLLERNLGRGVDPSIKFGSNQDALVLHSVQCSQQPFPQYCELLSTLCTEFRQTRQPLLTGGGQIRQ